MRILLILLCLELILPLHGAEANLNLATDGRQTLAAELAKITKAPRPKPGIDDGRIANTTALMLEQANYLHEPFDATLSSRFLDRYIATLDPQHVHFLQSDLDEFETYRTHLGELTIKQFDSNPAYVIYNRFLERLQQQAAYVSQLLDHGPFDFTGNEKIQSNRKQEPFPKDMAEARQLWRDRLRYEYLQERLVKEGRGGVANLLVSHHDMVGMGLAWNDFHNDIVNTLSRRYSRILRTFREWDGDKVLEIYLSALASVYDPHSEFTNKADFENFSISMSLSLFGIGAVLTSEDGFCKIRELTPSGPAFNSKKLKPNDRIVAVAQGDKEPVDVVDMPLNKVVDQIRGPKGTEVRLTIIPAKATDSSTRVVVKLTRDQIKLEDQQAKARIVELPDGKGNTQRLGVIDIPSFYGSFPTMGARGKSEFKSTTVDVARLLAKLKQEKVAGVILDLRRNPGGFLQESVSLTGLFIKEGPVVQTLYPSGEIVVDADTNPDVQYDGPLVVLTSRLSASASEILAGALQDYGRALVVGDSSTFGKGTVQNVSQLAPYIFSRWSGMVETNDPAAFGALRFTTQKFYRASGFSTQLKGVVPDIILPSIDDYVEVGESFMENPLPWDTIATAKFDKLNRVQPYLTELGKRSQERVAGEKDFAYVREDIEKVKKAMADKSVSLNEQQRLKELEEADAQQKAREQELKSRKVPTEKIYEITLKNVDLPGLPAPLGQSNVTASATKAVPEVHLDPAAIKVSATALAAEDDNSIPAVQPADPEEDVAAEEKTPSVDVPLVEAQRILADYISLLSQHEGTLTANHPSVAP
ncbi:MAG: carboxyl-terminal processing protease [Pedosphaera sp.]|nr:carboxyl-terminal processing protease [Pedosphaera sp.]